MEPITHSKHTSHQIQRSLSFTFLLKIVTILLINILKLLHNLVQLTNHYHRADVDELHHEVETEDLDVLVAVLDADDDGVDYLALVEAVLFYHVLEEGEGCFSDL